MERRGGLTRRIGPPLQIAVAAVLALSGLGGFVISRDARDANDRADFERRAAVAAVALVSAFDDLELDVTNLALADPATFVTEADAVRRSTVASAIGLVDATNRDVIVAIPASSTSDISEALAATAVRSAISTARDRGQGVATSFVSQAKGKGLLAAPVLDVRMPATTTEQRRTATTGLVIAIVDFDEVIASTAEELLADGSAIGLTDGGATLVVADGEFASVSDHAVAVGGAVWTLEFYRAAPGVGLLAWAVAFVAAGLVLLVLLVGQRLQRASDRMVSIAEARRRELELAADLGPILQASLDLGDVLPAAAVRLADELNLSAVKVLSMDPSGRLTSLYTHGRVDISIATAKDLPPIPEAPTPGDVIAVPLRRAGRLSGALVVVPAATISQDQMRALTTLADLMAGAVSNAELFRREQEAADRLRDVDVMKTEFLGTVSHELRTPVTAIAGYGDMLQEDWATMPDDQKLGMLERIVSNAVSLHNLVQQLLDFARLERQSLTVRLEALDLSDVVSTVMGDFAVMVDDHEIEVHVEPDSMVTADRQGVERILSNLVTNAIKYSPPETRVDVTVETRGTFVVLRVDDQGEGIAEEERERVFSRFYRGDHDLARRTRGAGIGLAVVSELCARMDAEAVALSSPAGGTRMEVRFPLLTDEGPSASNESLVHQHTPRSES